MGETSLRRTFEVSSKYIGVKVDQESSYCVRPWE